MEKVIRSGINFIVERHSQYDDTIEDSKDLQWIWGFLFNKVGRENSSKKDLKFIFDNEYKKLNDFNKYIIKTDDLSTIIYKMLCRKKE